jgi:hypothetical protein
MAAQALKELMFQDKKNNMMKRRRVTKFYIS